LANSSALADLREAAVDRLPWQLKNNGRRNLTAFLKGDIDIVYRWTEGDLSRQPALASELVAHNPE
jgi:hypothetical protein